jgi:hypothetical protein
MTEASANRPKNVKRGMKRMKEIRKLKLFEEAVDLIYGAYASGLSLGSFLRCLKT